MSPDKKISVSFIGSGNVAYHLATGLAGCGVRVDAVWSPTRKHAEQLAQRVKASVPESLSALPLNSDYYLLAVSDDQIEQVVREMPAVAGTVAHTSGITAMQTVTRRFSQGGVFYPLQTFSKARPVHWPAVPVCIEGNNETVCGKLIYLAEKLTGNYYQVNSVQREQLHLTAVMVSNFVNHLYRTGYDLLEQNDLPFDLLKPLIKEVASKIETLTPAEAQTGPAKRNDKKTIEKHIGLLKNNPELSELYQLITRQILKHYYE